MFRSYKRWRKIEHLKQAATGNPYDAIVEHIMGCNITDTHEVTDIKDKVIEEYTALCGSVWDGVKVTLPEELLVYQEDSQKLLCGTIMVLYQNIEFHYGEMKNILMNKTREPMDISTNLAEQGEAHETDEPATQEIPNNRRGLPESVKNRVLKTLDTVPLDYFVNINTNVQQLFEQKYIEKDSFEPLLHNGGLLEFLHRAGRLCWKLITREPAFTLAKPHQMHPWQEKYADRVELLEGSNTTKESKFIQYYCKPVLLDGQTVLCKGSVYVNSPGN